MTESNSPSLIPLDLSSSFSGSKLLNGDKRRSLKIEQSLAVIPYFHRESYKSESKSRVGDPGLDVATCGAANATSFYSVAIKFSRLVANLAPKIGDFLLWENLHQ